MCFFFIVCVIGYVFIYGGGGFVVDLGYIRENVIKIIEILEVNNWIDV